MLFLASVILFLMYGAGSKFSKNGLAKMGKFIGSFLAVSFVTVFSGGSLQALAAPDASPSGRQLVMDNCASCHQETSKGHLFRINDVRKTPEGWDMTLFRMQHVHGVQLKSDDRAKIIAYLATTQGLAPSETEGYRYVLEQRANATDKVVDPELGVMCGRCHTNARYALQRRDAAEWLRHMNFHVGQWPSLEYQASSRDRFWWQIATTELPAKLGKMYPLKTAAWDKWKAEKHPGLAGSWRIIGWQPGAGMTEGVATYKALGKGRYEAEYNLKDAAGESLQGKGKSIVYTGYEWRGDVKFAATEIREVYAASENGQKMTGRWFDPAHTESGADVEAVKIVKGKASLLAASPAYVKAGTSTEVTLLGMGLAGTPDFGPGAEVKVVSADGNHMVVAVTLPADAKTGLRDVKVGKSSAKGLVVVYDHVDSVKVTPEYAIARLGGGHTPPVTSQFEAVGYMNGPDGKSGTADDIRIGVMKATFTAKPFDEEAAKMDDVKFAGTLSGGGLFMPNTAGPDPERKYSTNNAGNLYIVATVKDGDHDVTGSAHLITTVQRWNLPPIR
jgi:quinohemoprotein amine dehydrogenase